MANGDIVFGADEADVDTHSPGTSVTTERDR